MYCGHQRLLVAAFLLPMSYDEIHENRARRLYQLRKRQALQGIDTPPEVVTEIEDLEAQGVRPEARGGAVVVADIAMPPWFNLYLIWTAGGVSAALLMGVLNFVLILVLRGQA